MTTGALFILFTKIEKSLHIHFKFLKDFFIKKKNWFFKCMGSLMWTPRFSFSLEMAKSEAFMYYKKLYQLYV